MLKKFAVPLIVLMLVVAAASVLFKGGDVRTLTAKFPRTVSLYQGSDVRVLGVPVGKIDSVTPSGTDVIVTMHYDTNVKLPANAKAVIVSPSIVGDRFVQLTPVYQGGPTLRDGATLDTSQTAVPLELDQIYSSLDNLTVALGPNGANRKGALTDLLNVTARNFGGQGAKFHQTIEDYSRLSQTLDNNKNELFGSARALEGFVNTLAKNDKTVRGFNTDLASVSKLLSGERGDLSASLRNLAVALRQVSGFVRDNRQILGRNITGLNQITHVLATQRSALDETLRDAPLALNNLALTYNPEAGTLDTRNNTGEVLNQITSNPAAYLCGYVSQADTSGQTCQLIQQALGGGGVPPIPGAPRTGALSSGRAAPPTDQSDPSLGGLVGVSR